MYNIGGAKNEVKAGTNLSDFEAGYQGQGNLEAEDRIKNLNTEAVAVVSMEVKGCGDVGFISGEDQVLSRVFSIIKTTCTSGRFGVYSSVKPRKRIVVGDMVDFAYDSDSGLLTLNLDDLPPTDQKMHIIEVKVYI
ncbi:hypothetical protein T459_14438 [Capsicum annuum]|uniref:Uncharacterized protein n=1 Tax=Capsicum annuum TaxID=4072 RepID=A0A2G2ZHG8_CAPAN|nr:hypothetical protein T459_14438 [Capsicum annuum]